MVTEQELKEAINELESAPASYQACEKLAVFYALHDRLTGQNSTREKQQKQNAYDFSPAVAPVSDFKRAAESKDWSVLLDILDEAMDTVKVYMPKLYDAIMRRIQE